MLSIQADSSLPSTIVPRGGHKLQGFCLLFNVSFIIETCLGLCAHWNFYELSAGRMGCVCVREKYSLSFNPVFKWVNLKLHLNQCQNFKIQWKIEQKINC